MRLKYISSYGPLSRTLFAWSPLIMTVLAVAAAFLPSTLYQVLAGLALFGILAGARKFHLFGNPGFLPSAAENIGLVMAGLSPLTSFMLVHALLAPEQTPLTFIGLYVVATLYCNVYAVLYLHMYVRDGHFRGRHLVRLATSNGAQV